MSTSTQGLSIETLTHTPAAGWSAPEFPAIDSDRTLVLVFGAPSYLDDPAAIRQLLDACPRAHVIGCSTAGEIRGTAIADGSLVVAAARFEHTPLRVAGTPIRAPGESFAAGQSIARRLHDPSLRAIFVLSDGLLVNGSELVRGINESVPEGVIVTGGLAGDGEHFQRTWVLDRDGLRSGGVVAVGLYGARLRVGHGSRGGWDCFGPERRITRSAGNVLYELDGKPVLPLYKEYLGERAAGLPASALLFPMSLRTGPEDDKRLVRTILSIDEAAQSLTFAGDMPEGCLTQLMCANVDRLIEGAGDSAALTRRGSVEGPCLAVAISCVGRRIVLRQRAEEELEAALDGLPPLTTQVGFYSYGELSPYASGRCDLHNQTMTLTTFGET